MQTKVCSVCKQEKTADEFNKCSKNKNGLSEKCRKCNVIAVRSFTKKYKLNNKGFDYSKERKIRCYACKKIKSSFLFYKNKCARTGFNNICKTCLRELHRQHDYGITPDALCALIKQQNNQCAICGTVFTKEFHVDHCHITNIVRGLLCEKCNLALGLFKDSPAILRSAISYLEQSSVKEKTHVA